MTRRRKLGLSALALAWGAGVACGGAEFTAPVGHGRAVDAGRDGAAADVSARDAGSSGPPRTWCSRQGSHDFCADFDLPDPSGAFGWEAIDRTGGTLDITPAAPVSPPNALLSTTLGGGARGLVEKSVTRKQGDVTQVRFSLNLRVDAAPPGPTPSAQAAQLRFDPAPGGEAYALGLIVTRARQIGVTEAAHPHGRVSTVSLPMHEWVRVEWDLLWSAPPDAGRPPADASGAADASDDEPAATGTTRVVVFDATGAQRFSLEGIAVHAPPSPASIVASAGLISASSSDPGVEWGIAYDDVTLDWQ